MIFQLLQTIAEEVDSDLLETDLNKVTSLKIMPF
jgi:hypothetical protein